jgi:hypothetical protein
MVREKHPIVAILEIHDQAAIEDASLTAKDFKFAEWAYVNAETVSGLSKV